MAEERPSKGSYIAAIIVNLIALLIFSNLLKWRVPFITQDFIYCLPMIKLSIVASILANAIFIVFDWRIFRKAVEILLAILGIIVTYNLYTIYPFDFPGEMDLLVKFALLVALIITVIVTIVTMVFLPLQLLKKD